MSVKFRFFPDNFLRRHIYFLSTGVWIRIHISKRDPDPGNMFNADPDPDFPVSYKVIGNI